MLIPTLEERLIGRFKWGLITDVQPPDVETRLAILRNKAERDHVQVPQETLEFIATRISSNIRELEGALIRVTAFASLSGVPITTELAQNLLADLLGDTSVKPRTDEELLAEIADILGFEIAALKGKSRQRPLVTGRQIAMYVFRDLTELSYPSIARVFGGRDHTTVIHAVDKIAEAHERAQADLRPSHRSAPEVEGMSASAMTLRVAASSAVCLADISVDSVGTPARHLVDNSRSSTERHRCDLAAGDGLSTARAVSNRLYAAAMMGYPQSTGPTTTITSLERPMTGKAPL